MERQEGSSSAGLVQLEGVGQLLRTGTARWQTREQDTDDRASAINECITKLVGVGMANYRPIP